MALCADHERRDKAVRIADAGFPFLLKDARTQVWTLLLLYIRMLEEEDNASGSASVQEVLSFVFPPQLPHARRGTPLPPHS